MIERPTQQDAASAIGYKPADLPRFGSSDPTTVALLG